MKLISLYLVSFSDDVKDVKICDLGLANKYFVFVLCENELSKHLKGQLDPPVSNMTFFASKEVGWIPLSVT